MRTALPFHSLRSGAGMTAGVLAARSSWPDPGLAGLVALVALGVALYALILRLLRSPELSGLLALLRR